MGSECEEFVAQLKSLVKSLTREKESLMQECQDLKRQRETSSKESADYAALLESQLETSNVSFCVRLQTCVQILCCPA